MLSFAQLEAIKQFDTCMVANAIEQFGVRLRNQEFTRPVLCCVTNGTTRLLGYASTSRVRSSDPPIRGKAYLDRTDWWAALDRLPQPRIEVIQDVDPEPRDGACMGEVHAAILKALCCGSAITNGAVRDLPTVNKLKFPLFAPFVTVSHSYMHPVDSGEPVEIFGLKVRAGDLLYIDCPGVISIPLEIAARNLEGAVRIQAKEQNNVHLSPDFSTERLLSAIRSEQQ